MINREELIKVMDSIILRETIADIGKSLDKNLKHCDNKETNEEKIKCIINEIRAIGNDLEADYAPL